MIPASKKYGEVAIDVTLRQSQKDRCARSPNSVTEMNKQLQPSLTTGDATAALGPPCQSTICSCVSVQRVGMMGKSRQRQQTDEYERAKKSDGV